MCLMKLSAIKLMLTYFDVVEHISCPVGAAAAGGGVKMHVLHIHISRYNLLDVAPVSHVRFLKMVFDCMV